MKSNCSHAKLLEKVARVCAVEGKLCLIVTLGFEASVWGWAHPYPWERVCSFLSLGGQCEWIYALCCDSNTTFPDQQMLWNTFQMALLPNPPPTTGPASQGPFPQLGDPSLRAQVPVQVLPHQGRQSVNRLSPTNERDPELVTLLLDSCATFLQFLSTCSVPGTVI